MLVMYNNVRIKNMFSVKYIFFMVKCQFMYVKSKLQISHDTIMLLPLDKLEYFTHYETEEYLTSACFTQPTQKKLVLRKPIPCIF